MAFLARYVPVLSDKRAELHALASLPTVPDAMDVLPLIDVREPQRPDKSRRPWSPGQALHGRVFDESNGLVGCWSHEHPLLVDLRRIDPQRYGAAHHPAEEFLDWCAAGGLHAIPVTSRDRPSEYREAVVRACRRLHTGAAVRLRGADLGAGSASVTAVLRELDLPRSQVDLVFDLQDIPVTNWFVLSDVAIQYVRAHAPLTSWRSVSVVGTSFPSDLYRHVDYDSHEAITRVEHDLWQRVRSGAADRLAIGYGDYGIVDAAPQPGFRGAANIRYTLESRWLVLRGFPPDKAPPDDYSRLARELRSLDGWYGDDHCVGCRFMADRAEQPPSGNATQWRQAGFSHHFAVTLDALKKD